MVLGIFKIALHLRDPHAFIRQSLEILNVFNTLTLTPKTKTFFKKTGVPFLDKVLRLKTHHFHSKLPYRKLMLRLIEW